MYQQRDPYADPWDEPDRSPQAWAWAHGYADGITGRHAPVIDHDDAYDDGWTEGDGYANALDTWRDGNGPHPSHPANPYDPPPLAHHPRTWPAIAPDPDAPF